MITGFRDFLIFLVAIICFLSVAPGCGKKESEKPDPKEKDVPRFGKKKEFKKDAKQEAELAAAREKHRLERKAHEEKIVAALEKWAGKPKSAEQLAAVGYRDADQIAFSADGDFLVLGSQPNEQSYVIRIIDLTAGKETKKFSTNEKNIFRLSVSADGSLLAADTLGGPIVVFDAKDGKTKTKIPGDIATFSPRGRQLAVREEPKLKVVDAETGKVIQSFDVNGGAVTTFSPDGAVLASLEQTVSGDKVVNKIALWDVVNGGKILETHGGDMFAFSPDGWQMAVAQDNSRDGTKGAKVILWDLESNKKRNLVDSKFRIPSLAVSPDNKILAFETSGDGVFIIDLESGKEIRHLKYQGGKPFFFPGGLLLGFVSPNSVSIWSVPELINPKKKKG